MKVCISGSGSVVGFVYAGQKNLNPARHDDRTMGEQYLFIAPDSQTKPVVPFLVGTRNAEKCYYLMRDLPDSLNVENNSCDAADISTEVWSINALLA